ncbi:MAG: hypothetical protein MJ141_02860 [Clostridia bacterium]|nr:hypothetical protein [Clostridia bacterium]
MNQNQDILTAEMVFSDKAIKPDLASFQEATAAVDAELKSYINHADTFDYALAAASGVLCGALDSVFVGAFSVDGDPEKKVMEWVKKEAQRLGYKGDSDKGAIEFFENRYKASQDNVWSGAGIKVSAKDHHLADLAHHPTPLGLIASIVTAFTRYGIFINKEGEISFLKVKTTPKDLISVWLPVILSALFDWLAILVMERLEEEKEAELPKAVKALVHTLAASPLLIEILQVARNWAGHLISDVSGSNSTAGAGMGIPGLFYSFAYEIAGLPVLKGSNLLAVIDKLYVKNRMDFRYELPELEALGKQAAVVMINETIVRGFYFVRQLIRQYQKTKDLRAIDWEEVIPFNNRTILRMMTVSEATFALTDTADAALRSAVASAGDGVLFAANFLSRVNYVGWGRLAISVYKEVSMSEKEAALLRERRRLIEEVGEKNMEAILAYRERMEELVDEYLAEDLQAFLSGFEDMEAGIASGDSNLVIHGNVTIQTGLGREIQFETQEEFDDLMLSDEALKL